MVVVVFAVAVVVVISVEVADIITEVAVLVVKVAVLVVEVAVLVVEVTVLVVEVAVLVVEVAVLVVEMAVIVMEVAVRLRGVMHTTESDSMGVMHTADSKCKPSSLYRKVYRSLHALQGIITYNPLWLNSEHIHYDRIAFNYKKWGSLGLTCLHPAH